MEKETTGINCGICQKNVTIVNRQEQNNKTIWACNDCDAKHQRWKT